jgi:hypothetical protein
MTVRFQIELSDQEVKIVEVYRIEHNKKNNEEAIKEIVGHYKKPEKKSWLSKLQ